MTAGGYAWNDNRLPTIASPRAGKTTVLELKHVERCEEGISTPSSPRVEHEGEGARGSEILGYIASGPALFLFLMNLLNPSTTIFWINGGLRGSIVVALWYFFVLAIESALQLSPMLQRLISANTEETTEEVLQRVKETETARVEVVMKCYKELKRGSDIMEQIWEGRSTFPVGAVADSTDISGGLEKLRAVLIEYETRLEFVDERSKIDFDRHVNNFEVENKHRGDAYELAYALNLPNVRDRAPMLTYGDLSRRRPLRASLFGFYLFAACGLTIPYRLASKRLVPDLKVTVVKRVSSVWPGRATDCDFDKYPSVDYGA